MSRSRNQLSAQRRKARHYGVQALYQWHMAGGDPESIMLEFCKEYDFSGVDVNYFTALLSAIPSAKNDLEAILVPFLDRDLSDLDPIELTLLRLGTYELRERQDVPFKVVISEAVSLAKKFGATDSHKYVNGVLDQVARVVRTDEVEV